MHTAAIKTRAGDELERLLAACKTLAKKARVDKPVAQPSNDVADELGASVRHAVEGRLGISWAAGMMAKALHAATMTTQRLA